MSELASIKERLGTIETEVADLKKYVHEKEHERSNADMIRDGRLSKVEQNTVEILSFVDGGKKVFGFAKKHWKTALTFGAGIMTALGIGNPQVNEFISNFVSVSS